MYQTFAHQINRAKALIDGLTAYGDDVTQLGITKDFVTKLTDLYTKAGQTEQTRNELKATSKLATANLGEIMSKLNGACSLAKKSIRIFLPEEKWPSFGFQAGEFAAKEATDTPATT